MLESIDYKWVLAALAAFISICNFGYYVSTIIKGKSKPHLCTWLIWSIVAFTIAGGQLYDGAGVGATTAIIAGLNSSVVVVFSFLYGSKNFTLSDKIYLITCLFALLLWPLTKSPLFSVIIVTLVDLIGYIPTIRKSYKAPHEESIFLFVIFLVTCSLALLALENYTFITMVYLITMNVANICMATMLILRRRALGYEILS